LFRLLAVTAAACWAAGSLAAGLPPYVLEWPKSTGDILVAETATYTLHHYRREADGTLAVQSHPMSIGQMGAGKRREGDLKTPYGIYFIVDRIDTTPLHAKYGSAAFPVDYPNARDRQLGRTGDGIWLHGVLPGTVTPISRDTDGCIALNNDTLDALVPRLKSGSTPLIVTPSLNSTASDDSNRVRDQLKQRVESWAKSLNDGRLSQYLAHYADSFSYQGLNRDDWSVLQFEPLARQDLADATVDKLFIAAEPEEAGLYVSRFLLRLRFTDGTSRAQTKRLYWQRDAAGELYIVAEDET
jgi:murein L,D-transpeptidase YafK